MAIFAIGLPLYAQYAGPAILARGEAPAAMSGLSFSFRPYVSFSSSYNSGLAGVAITDQGQLATASSYGATISGGISGSHRWKHTNLGLDYRGSYGYYPRVGQQNNSYDQTFLFGVTHQFSRHLVFDLRESGGLFTRDFGIAGLSQTVPFDPAASFVPTTDFFDNRTIYLTSQASVTYQRSRRLSFAFSGGLFINRRLSTALYGSVGEVASGDVQYRLSRSQTIGAVYNFNHMGYTHVFGGTYVHGVAGSYSVRFNRTVELSATGGAVRQEDTFLQQLPVDPVIAALLGITNSVQIFHDRIWHPHFMGRLSKTVHNGVFYFSAGNSVTPGNGLFLTSYATSVQGGYSFTGLRRWSIGVTAADTWAQAYGNVSGNYGGGTGTLAVSRRLRGGVSSNFALGVRRYQSSDFNNYNRLIYNATMGISFSPGDIPLRIW
jgi:hypothetical protein